MVQTIQAQKLNLFDLEEKFALEFIEDKQFFNEWQEDLPQLSDAEKQALDEIKQEYRHLYKYLILEPVVQLVVLSPLLKLAGFYKPPFYLSAEKEVRIVSEDEGTVVTGRLDLLVFTPNFWVLVIESKGAKYSLEVGIPQALAYMLDSPHSDKPVFGFVTNGIDFIFLKLINQENPQYGESYSFSLRRNNDIYTVLSILKKLSQLASQTDSESSRLP